MNARRLDRRALLRGAGAGSIAVALPPLEAMFDSRGRLPGRALAANGAQGVLLLHYHHSGAARIDAIPFGPGTLERLLLPVIGR